MAASSRSIIHQDREHTMKKTNIKLTSVTDQPGRRPVRVRLRRINANLAKSYPPDGENRVWWTRLKQALGTRSSDFVNASLYQLQAAARLPCSGISEIAMNAALAMIEAAAPRDEMEAALAIQMACTHAATMSVLARLEGGIWDRTTGGSPWIGCGSAVESLFGTGRGLSTASAWGPAARSGRACPYQWRRPGHYWKCELERSFPKEHAGRSCRNSTYTGPDGQVLGGQLEFWLSIHRRRP
jgi:hypothetical protein